MSLEYHKQQYEAKAAAIEAKYKKMAEIWHAKGRKAFSNALENGIPNWNNFFEKEWAKFTTIKIKCGKCGHVRDFKTDWDKNIVPLEEFKGYYAVMCPSCCGMVEIKDWKVIE